MHLKANHKTRDSPSDIQAGNFIDCHYYCYNQRSQVCGGFDAYGTTESLANMAKSVHAVVAINGTFFNSWGNKFPTGTIEINGQFESAGQGTLLAFGSNGNMLMTRAKETLSGTIEDQTNPSVTGLWPWYINSPSTNSGVVDILTSYFGKTMTNKNADLVSIADGKVTSVKQGSTTIPSNGYSVEIGKGEKSMLSRIHPGDPASVSVNVENLKGQAINISKYPNALGCGPMLVDDRQVVLNPSLEGFKDPTLVDSNTLRSFAGIDAKGDLVLGTIHAATLSTEADIAKKLGLKQAMNLDGGSSAGLYLNGRYVTPPGRNLSTALVVTYK
ncbi:hypothetical protein AAC03nite_33510 [Alicyclobacillus acidoterrestris]|nr:hypothetical protein AAC03nite_33510 [Alicyclobacillus acidoterrestris]